MELLEDNQYHVVVTAFGSCKSFYVQVVDNSSNWTELTKMLSNLRNLQPILSPKAGMMCIVRFEGEYHRAKIIRDSETTIICFCVDTGETVYFHLEPVRVYEISPELLKFMPFQAINCRLYGVKVPTDASLTNFVHRKVIMRMVEQRILVKQSIQNPDKIPWGLEGVNSYDVILFQARELRDEIIEDVLVNLQLADYDF